MDVLLAMVFAVVAGAGTALSPCVLPVLPVVLSAGASGARRRPLGVAIGLTAGLAFAAVALSELIDALGLPDGTVRTLAVVVLALFGIALLVPPLSASVEARLSRLVTRAPGRGRGDGLRSGLVLGASLGLLYAPCAGPILAAVVALDASLSPARGLLGLAYAAGAGLALLGVMIAGRRATRRLAPRAGRLHQGLGAVMVVTAVLLGVGLDRDFQAAIAADLPAFLVNPTERLERSRAVDRTLQSVRPGRARPARASSAPVSGRRLPDLGAAPAFTGTQRWFNTPGGRALTLGELRGRVVLIDFWTYTCINCLRTLPHLRAWDERYRRAGLTVVGVHTPEFAFERNADNVRSAIAANKLRYPVVQDNAYATWNAYLNQYWPAKYLIDANGQVRYTHFGEGDYDETERAIRALLAESGRRPGADAEPVIAERAEPATTTPETYLGWMRPQDSQRFKDGPLPIGDHDLGLAAPRLEGDQFAFRGSWTFEREHAVARQRARIEASVNARRVFLVLGSRGRPRTLTVRVNGRVLPNAFAGSDARDGRVRVGTQRLYRLVDLDRARPIRLSLELEPGIAAYAFTFG